MTSASPARFAAMPLDALTYLTRNIIPSSPNRTNFGVAGRRMFSTWKKFRQNDPEVHVHLTGLRQVDLAASTSFRKYGRRLNPYKVPRE